MEPVMHPCGQRLYRQEVRPVPIGPPIVLYSDGQREIHACPRCGDALRDTDLRDADGQPILPASASWATRPMMRPPVDLVNPGPAGIAHVTDKGVE
jgi:hypothetical protein